MFYSLVPISDYRLMVSFLNNDGSSLNYYKMNYQIPASPEWKKSILCPSGSTCTHNRSFGAMKSDKSVIYIAQHFNKHYQIYGLSSASGAPTFQVHLTDPYPSSMVHSMDEANDRLFIVHYLRGMYLTVFNTTTQEVMYSSNLDQNGLYLSHVVAHSSDFLYLFGQHRSDDQPYVHEGNLLFYPKSFIVD